MTRNDKMLLALLAGLALLAVKLPVLVLFCVRDGWLPLLVCAAFAAAGAAWSSVHDAFYEWRFTRAWKRANR